MPLDCKALVSSSNKWIEVIFQMEVDVYIFQVTSITQTCYGMAIAVQEEAALEET